MALADDLKPVIDSIRAIPGQLGLRPNRVFLVEGSWSGDYTGELNEVRDTTELLVGDQPPKVRRLNDEQLAVGELAEGAIEVGPVTPSYTGGGVSVADLIGSALTNGETLILRLVGPEGTTHYRITKRFFDRAMHYKIQAEPVSKEA